MTRLQWALIWLRVRWPQVLWIAAAATLIGFGVAYHS